MQNTRPYLTDQPSPAQPACKQTFSPQAAKKKKKRTCGAHALNPIQTLAPEHQPVFPKLHSRAFRIRNIPIDMAAYANAKKNFSNVSQPRENAGGKEMAS